jgi:hypothetical protein
MLPFAPGFLANAEVDEYHPQSDSKGHNGEQFGHDTSPLTSVTLHSRRRLGWSGSERRLEVDPQNNALPNAMNACAISFCAVAA